LDISNRLLSPVFSNFIPASAAAGKGGGGASGEAGEVDDDDWLQPTAGDGSKQQQAPTTTATTTTSATPAPAPATFSAKGYVNMKDVDADMQDNPAAYSTPAESVNIGVYARVALDEEGDGGNASMYGARIFVCLHRF
jgi:hypothetical protein